VISGVGAALVAVIPAMRAAADIPVGSLVALIAVMTAMAWLWIEMATRAALRGRLLEALRAE
jgi:hypothetical protein